MALKKVNGLWFDEHMSDEEIAEAMRNIASRKDNRSFGDKWSAFDWGAGGEAASDDLLDDVFGVEADDNMVESTAKTLGDWFIGSPIRFGAGIGEQIADWRGVEGRDKKWGMDDVWEGALSIPALRGIKAGAGPLWKGLQRAFGGGLKGPGKTNKVISGLDDVVGKATRPTLGAGHRKGWDQAMRSMGGGKAHLGGRAPWWGGKFNMGGRGGKMLTAAAVLAGATGTGMYSRGEKANAKVVNEGETDGTEKTQAELEEEIAAKEKAEREALIKQARATHPSMTDPVIGPFLERWNRDRQFLQDIPADESPIPGSESKLGELFNPSLFPNDPASGRDKAMNWDQTPHMLDVPKVGSKKWEANKEAGLPQGRQSNFIAQGQIQRADEWRSKLRDRQAKIDQYAPQMEGVEDLDSPADKMKWIMDYNRRGGADPSPATPSNPAQPQAPQATKPAPDLDDDGFPWGKLLGGGAATGLGSYALWKLLTRGKGGGPPPKELLRLENKLRGRKGLDMKPPPRLLENKLSAPIRLPGPSSTSMPGGRPLSEAEKFRRASTGMDETTQAAARAAERAALEAQRRSGIGPYPDRLLDIF